MTAAVFLVVAGMMAGAGATEPRVVEKKGDRPFADKGAPPRPGQRIDLNSASREQLMTLPGIGEREARKIIARRPWATKIDLVIEGILPEGVYIALKNRIEVRNPVAPRDRPPKKK